MAGEQSPTSGVRGPHGGQPVVSAGAPRGAVEAVVVALHGRGATAQGVVNLLDPVARRGVRIVAPAAERSRWYPHSATAPIERNQPHLDSAIAVVEAVVADAVAGFGVDRPRVVLFGFSQGACVAAEFAARRPTRYGGVVVLSGILPGETVDSRRYDGDLNGTPVLVGYGSEDPTVDPDRVDATAAVFEDLGGEVDRRCYEGVGHEVTDDEFDYLDGLLVELFGEYGPGGI